MSMSAPTDLGTAADHIRKRDFGFDFGIRVKQGIYFIVCSIVDAKSVFKKVVPNPRLLAGVPVVFA